MGTGLEIVVEGWFEGWRRSPKRCMQRFVLDEAQINLFLVLCLSGATLVPLLCFQGLVRLYSGGNYLSGHRSATDRPAAAS